MKIRNLATRKVAGTPIQLAIFTLIASMGAAQAQNQTQPPSPSAQAQNKADSNSATISEVIVTGTKRATSLQRTPVAITAINAAALEDAHVQNVQDVVNLVPGFQATGQGDHGVITMTMRGIGNDSAKTEYADPEVALFIDGIYAPRPEGATSLLFDLEGIEVLRGPQGTLWGRNATVGAVNMQTTKAKIGESSGNLEGGLGSYKRFGTRGAFNIPVSDEFALRFAFVHEKHDGYVDYQMPPTLSLDSQKAAFATYLKNGGTVVNFQPINYALFVQDGPKYGAQDQSAARISMLWKPNAATRIDLSYEKFIDRGTPSMNLLQNPRPGTSHWSALIDTAPYLQRDTDSIRGRIEYAIDKNMQLTYIGGYSKFSGSSRFDQDGGANVPTSFTSGGSMQANNTVSSNYKNFSHEVELQSVGTREVDWQLGLYYGSETNDIRFDIPILNGTYQGTVGWQGSFIQPKETVETAAAFGQATWNLSSSTHFTGGLRFTSDKRTNVGGRGYGFSGKPELSQSAITPNVDPASPNSNFAAYSFNDGSYSGSKMTGLLRLSHDIDKDNMIYGSISTGYKSGGLQDGGKTYGPETLTNFEIGTKSSLMGGTIRLNNALYYGKFKDFQFSAPVTAPDGTRGLQTSNADGATVYGFESELAAKLSKDDKLQITLALAKATLGNLIGGSNDYALPACKIPGISNCLDVSNNTMPHTPKFSAQVMYQHTFHLDQGTLTPRISLHYETDTWLSVFNYGDGDKQEAYGRADLGLRYQSSGKTNWYADFFVRNVSDNKIKTSAMNANGLWQAQYLPPRTIGFNVGIDF